MKSTLRAVKAVILVLCLGLLLGRAAVMGQRRATADTATAATQFLASLTPEQRATANLTFDDANRFDWHYVPRPGQRKGLPLKDMTPAQRQAAQTLLGTALSAKGMKQTSQAGFDKVSFAWIGADALREPHYYRVQGPTFLIEFDNVQTQANHIHSVWRDFNGDFGDDVLKTHYQSAHNQ